MAIPCELKAIPLFYSLYGIFMHYHAFQLTCGTLVHEMHVTCNSVQMQLLLVKPTKKQMFHFLWEIFHFLFSHKNVTKNVSKNVSLFWKCFIFWKYLTKMFNFFVEMLHFSEKSLTFWPISSIFLSFFVEMWQKWGNFCQNVGKMW